MEIRIRERRLIEMGERVDFSKISFRYELEANDKDLVAQITGSSRCFSEKEVSVAIELVGGTAC